MHVVALQFEHLAAATSVLAAACAFDRASDVAEEKLFGTAPLPAPLGPVLAPASPQPISPAAGGDASTASTMSSTASSAVLSNTVAATISELRSAAGASARSSSRTSSAALSSTGVAATTSSAVLSNSVAATTSELLLPVAFGAFEDGELIGVASVCARWLRVLAVVPIARGRGVGSALLSACVAHARMTGATRLRTLDQPGNYLAPGIDARNTETIAWLEKRGFVRDGEPRCNVLVAVRDNPRVSIERADAAAAAARARGYEVRRARSNERALIDAVQASFGGAWPFELECALEYEPAGVHVAMKDGGYCAFAAHDGNNRGLGWFGPTGTWPEHRGQGLGEALLLACLVDVARDHERCEVAWIGPRPFYDKVAGIVDERTFIAMVRTDLGA